MTVEVVMEAEIGMKVITIDGIVGIHPRRGRVRLVLTGAHPRRTHHRHQDHHRHPKALKTKDLIHL